MSGLRLRAVRETWSEDGALNQEWFASKIGVQRTALSNWEQGNVLPDVRAMVRLALVFGIPLEWIYLGQLRHVEYALADRLAQRAAELGAVVGGPTAEWPMVAERRSILAPSRPAAAVPLVRMRRSRLHEKQEAITPDDKG